MKLITVHITTSTGFKVVGSKVEVTDNSFHALLKWRHTDRQLAVKDHLVLFLLFVPTYADFAAH